MIVKYKPAGCVCARQLVVEVDEEKNTVEDVLFFGGCSGNAQGIARLVKGMSVDDVIERLKDIKCGRKDSSCPAELAKALRENFGSKKED